MAIQFGKKFGFGTLRLPLLNEKDQISIDYDTLKKMIDVYMEHGFTYFDTSYLYHDMQAEIALRECLVKRYPRDSFMLSSKLPVWADSVMKKEEDMERIFNEQLEKCGVEYFDFYLIHSIDQPGYEKCQKWNTFEFLKKKRAEGKFREFGISLHDTPEFLEQILTEHPEIDFVVEQINYIDWDNPGIRSKELYETAERHGKPIVVMETCKGGLLAEIPDEAKKIMKDYNPDASIASWAYRFAASLPNVRVVLSGMPKMEFLMDNIKTMENFVPLNDEEREIIQKVVDIINSNTPIPCTGCRYCEENGCPKNIAIPDYFALYNDFKRLTKMSYESNVVTQPLFYTNLVRHGRGAASECLKCRKCERACPQNINICDWLEKVTTVLENYDPENVLEEG